MSTKAYKPDYKSRLEAQKHRLESRSEESKMRILNKVDYHRTHGAEVVKTEALRALSDKSPVAAKLVGNVLGIKAPSDRPHTHIVRMDRDQDGTMSEHTRVSRLLRDTQSGEDIGKPSIVSRLQDSSWSTLLQDVVIPAGLAVGSSLLLAGTLRGAGSGLRGLTKGLIKGIGKGVFKL